MLYFFETCFFLLSRLFKITWLMFCEQFELLSIIMGTVTLLVNAKDMINRLNMDSSLSFSCKSESFVNAATLQKPICELFTLAGLLDWILPIWIWANWEEIASWFLILCCLLCATSWLWSLSVVGYENKRLVSFSVNL